jgi:uncharacterized FlgJ-related protein
MSKPNEKYKIPVEQEAAYIQEVAEKLKNVQLFPESYARAKEAFEKYKKQLQQNIPVTQPLIH